MTGSQPRLVLRQQNALAVEKFSENGVTKDVHVVVKNHPFDVHLSFLSSKLNKNVKFVAKLVYDTPEAKEVDFVRNKPMDYKTSFFRDGEKIIMEFRLKVLTRQLEDMFFLIRIDAVNESNRVLCSTLSNPIKVISKPDQLTRKTSRRVRKRPLTDDIKDTLLRIEESQQQQYEFLQKLMSKQDRSYVGKVEPGSSEDAFESSFTEALFHFQRISPRERSRKMRKIMDCMGDHRRTVKELVETLMMTSSPHFLTSSGDSIPLEGQCIAVEKIFPATSL